MKNSRVCKYCRCDTNSRENLSLVFGILCNAVGHWIVGILACAGTANKDYRVIVINIYFANYNLRLSLSTKYSRM